ncbi:MAG: beta-ketoacyl reductase, partial [Burkholderiales bacterium]|nr:beta-ketoacyl reductase [Burkholderiales bacterium]
ALEPAIENCLYQVEWLLLDVVQPHKWQAGERVLCIGSKVAAALAEKLAAAGKQSALLTLAQLSAGIAAPSGPLIMVYCAEDFAAGDDSSAALGFLKVIQVLEARDIAADVTVLTCNAAGLGQQAPCPRQSAVVGLLKTAALEYPQRRWQSLDIGSTGDALLADVLAGLDNEPQLALRENRCYAARLMPMTLRQPGKPVGIRKHRSYLVTGGAGALGFAVVEHLLARGAGSIVIAGRSGLDSLNAAQLARLDAAAATITGVAADLGQDGGIAKLLAALEGLPPLAGIVHAAGLLNDRVLSRMDEDDFRAPWAAKVDALRHLGEKLPTAALDFFVVFSSMAALTGSPGQGNYAAANAYVDAFMQARKQRGLAALSINWGPWRGGGMLDGAEALMAEKGIDSIAPEQGLAAFEILLNSDAAQAAVMSIRWREFLAALPKPSAFYQEQPEPVAVQGGLSLLLGDAEPARRFELLEQGLRRLIAQVLRNPGSVGIEARQRFFDGGFDSLLAMDFTNRLAKDLAIDLPSTLLFDYPTLEALLGFLVQRLAFDVQTAAVAVDDFDDCSDEQLARLLMQRLDS